jgi:hypothetical protein
MDVIRASSVYILLLLSLLESNVGKAQQGDAVLDKKMALPAYPIRMDSLNAWVVRRTGVVFSFNSGEIKPYKKVLIPREVTTLNTLLMFLKNGADMVYTVHGQYIVLHYRRPVPSGTDNHPALSAAPRPRLRSARSSQPHPDTAPTRSVTCRLTADSGTIALPPIPVVPPPGTRASIPPPFRAPLFPVKNYPDPGTNGNHSPHSSLRRDRSEDGPRDGPGPFVKAGVSADDIFYLNPTLQLGFSFLYGAVSWSKDAYGSSLRYGAGTSLPLGRGWTMGLAGTFGKLSRQCALSPLDSFRVDTIVAKGSLTRLSLQVEKKIAKHLYIQFGPDFNILRTRYYNDDTLITPRQIMPQRETTPDQYLSDFNHNNAFSLVKAPYLISNTYQADASHNSRFWIGFHVGIFFRLDFFERH